MSIRRSLVLRDSLVFLSLLAISLLLFGITLALFRSFEAHRDSLGRAWAAQGKAALARHDPGAAVPALRAALSYKPDERPFQLLLAEALAGSGHLNEATSYFLNLWTARPGDGFVNLQLARLSRTRDDGPEALEYYRAAIFGDWGDQGPLRRRETRLELAQYLFDQHDPGAALTELLLAAGNAPDDAPVNLLIGAKLAAVGDLPSALLSFRRALAAAPTSTTALVRTGAVYFLLYDFTESQKLLNRAVNAHYEPPSQNSASQQPTSQNSAQTISSPGGVTADLSSTLDLPALPDLADTAVLAHDAEGLSALSLSRELPSDLRGLHLLHAATIAEARLKACAATPYRVAPAVGLPLKVTQHDPKSKDTRVSAPPSASLLPASLLSLAERWKATGRNLRRRSAAGNATAQDSLTDLIYATTRATSAPDVPTSCGPVEGENALLLLLSSTANNGPPLATPAVQAILSRATILATGVRP